LTERSFTYTFSNGLGDVNQGEGMHLGRAPPVADIFVKSSPHE